MRLIFSGDHEIIIGERNEIDLWEMFSREETKPHLMMYENHFNEHDLFELEQLFEKNLTPQKFYLCGEQGSEIEAAFISHYKIIEAAGGVVMNKKDKVLMMFRRGKWDLPKGKIDEGETIKQAAKREITEETGVKKLKIIRPVKSLFKNQDCSFHTYSLNGNRILKATYWFEMYCNYKEDLVPQAAEGITQVGWYSKSEVKENLQNSFALVKRVLDESGVL